MKKSNQISHTKQFYKDHSNDLKINSPRSFLNSSKTSIIKNPNKNITCDTFLTNFEEIKKNLLKSMEKNSNSPNSNFNSHRNHNKTSTIKEEDSYIQSSSSSIQTNNLIQERVDNHINSKTTNLAETPFNKFIQSNSLQSKHSTTEKNVIQRMSSVNSNKGYSSHYNNRANGSILKSSLHNVKVNSNNKVKKNAFHNLQKQSLVNSFYIKPQITRNIHLINYSFQPKSNKSYFVEKNIEDIKKRSSFIKNNSNRKKDHSLMNSERKRSNSKEICNKSHSKYLRESCKKVDNSKEKSKPINLKKKPIGIKSANSNYIKNTLSFSVIKPSKAKLDYSNFSRYYTECILKENKDSIRNKSKGNNDSLIKSPLKNEKSLNSYEKKDFSKSCSETNFVSSDRSKFSTYQMKDLYEIVRRNTSGNYDDLIPKIDELEINDDMKYKLVYPCLNLLKKRKLEFNFQNFYLVSQEIMSYFTF